jgi:hypothetical protein
MSSLSTLPKGDSAWLLRKAIERIMQQISVLETNIGSSTTGNSANTQIIFNDAGTLRGDAQFTWNKTLNRLTVDGDETISGDLTVATSTLKVDTINDRVGVGTANPGAKLTIAGAAEAVRICNAAPYITFYNAAQSTRFGYIQHNGTNIGIVNEQAGSLELYTNNTLQATLNATGLGVGLVPSGGAKLAIRDSGSNDSYIGLGANNDIYLSTGAAGIHYFRKGSAAASMMIDASGNVGVGVTPSASTIRTIQSQYGAIVGSDELNVTSNAYFGGSWKYVSAATAARYSQAAGVHYWFTAAAGAAANDPVTSFTAATAKMTLDANGNLILLSSATPATLATNGQLTVNATSNTNLRFSYRGSDGTTRVANITLA